MPHLLLTYDFPPIGGGLARYMAELARAYPAHGLHVSTGTQQGSEAFDETLPGRVHRIATGAKRLRTLPGLVRWSRQAGALVRRLGVGFVWCGNFKPAAYPARWVGFRYGVPYGIIVHGLDMYRVLEQVRRSTRKRRVARSLFGGASVVLANSTFTGELTREVLRQSGVSGAVAVRVVPLGTSPALFRPGLPTDEVRARYGLDPGLRWMLTVARLVEHKGVDTVIEALAILKDELPGLAYAVAGGGPRRGALEQLARNAGVADRVRFLGAVPDGDLPALYNTASLYLGVSRRVGPMVEGFGISLVEASASGIPVIGGLSGGIPDAVRQDETGLLVDPERPAAVAEAVRALLADPGRARDLGQGGRRAVEEFYNWERVARDVAAIAGEFAAGRPGAG